MNQAELEAIVELVTQQVLRATGRNETAVEAFPRTGKRLLLLGGTPAQVPEHLCRGAAFFGVDDYAANPDVRRYDCVVILRLTLSQLADIALGRDGDAVSCAVVHALLAGVEVLMGEDALPFRKYAGLGSTALYQHLEGYARTLRVYGVKPFGKNYLEEKPAPKPAKYALPPLQVPAGNAKPNADRVITEAAALELLRRGEEPPEGSILTPLAQDVLKEGRRG